MATRLKDAGRQVRQGARRTWYGVGREKVFCIGFQKTGTSSMGVALHQLGYRVAGHIRYPHLPTEAEVIGSLVARVHRYDAYQDAPWYLYYEIFAHAFPDARFIHTERDPERWYGSVLNFYGKATAPIHTFVYGAPGPDGHKDRFVARYVAHNEGVRRFFRDQPGRLLIMDLEAGHGWAELAAFLGVRVPRRPFPHINRRR